MYAIGIGGDAVAVLRTAWMSSQYCSVLRGSLTLR
jgi:hypothetical protein